MPVAHRRRDCGSAKSVGTVVVGAAAIAAAFAGSALQDRCDVVDPLPTVGNPVTSVRLKGKYRVWQVQLLPVASPAALARAELSLVAVAIVLGHVVATIEWPVATAADLFAIAAVAAAIVVLVR